jgi:hypothetical protein
LRLMVKYVYMTVNLDRIKQIYFIGNYRLIDKFIYVIKCCINFYQNNFGKCRRNLEIIKLEIIQ